MSEQKKENKAKEWFKKFKKPLTKQNRLYLLTATGCAVALIAIVVVSVAITGGKKKVNNQLQSTPPPAVDVNGGGSGSSEKPDEGKNDEPVVSVPEEGMVAPIATVAGTNDYGFYYNKTLNSYYEHVGVDFLAEKGTQVLAVDDGKVESIFKDDLLSGTEIVLNHGDGLRTVYRFITEVDGLKVGDKVKKGEVIATVAEATGDEYKDGPHLHFEVLKNGINEDPSKYLTLEEK